MNIEIQTQFRRLGTRKTGGMLANLRCDLEHGTICPEYRRRLTQSERPPGPGQPDGTGRDAMVCASVGPKARLHYCVVPHTYRG